MCWITAVSQSFISECSAGDLKQGVPNVAYAMTASAVRGSPDFQGPVRRDTKCYSDACSLAARSDRRPPSPYELSVSSPAPSTVTHKSVFRCKPNQPQNRPKQDGVVTKKMHFDDLSQKTHLFFPADAPLSLTSESLSSAERVSEAGKPARGSHFQLRRGGGFCTVNSTFSPPSTWQPTRLESLWLSPSGRSIRGTVAVHDIDFQKEVSGRFTFYDWKTVSDVAAEHCHSVYLKNSIVSDLFNFIIDKESLHLETGGHLQICACYTVIDSEFSDNNGGEDYRVAGGI